MPRRSSTIVRLPALARYAGAAILLVVLLRAHRDDQRPPVTAPATSVVPGAPGHHSVAPLWAVTMLGAIALVAVAGAAVVGRRAAARPETPTGDREELLLA